MDTPARPAREWPIPPMDHASGHKDTAFTWTMGRVILARIAAGETVKAITADPRMPAYCTVFQWMKVVLEFGEDVRVLRAALGKVKLAERAALRRVRASMARRRRGGKPSTYTDERARAVLARIEAGWSLSEAVGEPGAPSFKAWYGWLRTRPELRVAYAEACAVRAMVLDELICDAALGSMETGLAVAKARVRHLEGRIGRLRPRLYREGAVEADVRTDAPAGET